MKELVISQEKTAKTN